MKIYIILLLFAGGCGEDGSPDYLTTTTEPVSLNLATIHEDLEGQCTSFATRFSEANKPQCLGILTQEMCEAKYQFNIKKAQLDFETAYRVAETSLNACNSYTNGWFSEDCAAQFENKIAWTLSDCAKIH